MAAESSFHSYRDHKHKEKEKEREREWEWEWKREREEMYEKLQWQGLWEIEMTNTDNHLSHCHRQTEKAIGNLSIWKVTGHGDWGSLSPHESYKGQVQGILVHF